MSRDISITIKWSSIIFPSLWIGSARIADIGESPSYSVVKRTMRDLSRSLNLIKVIEIREISQGSRGKQRCRDPGVKRGNDW